MESTLHKEGSEDRTVMGRMCVVGGGGGGGVAADEDTEEVVTEEVVEQASQKARGGDCRYLNSKGAAIPINGGRSGSD